MHIDIYMHMEKNIQYQNQLLLEMREGKESFSTSKAVAAEAEDVTSVLMSGYLVTQSLHL